MIGTPKRRNGLTTRRAEGVDQAIPEGIDYATAERDRLVSFFSLFRRRNSQDSLRGLGEVVNFLPAFGRHLCSAQNAVPCEKITAGIEVLRKLGCEIVDIGMPHTDYAIATYYIIATAEASSNLARYDGVRFGPRAAADSLIAMYRKTRGTGFGAEVKRRIVLGTYVLSAGYYNAYYLKGQKVRALIADDFRKAFRQVDAIVTPTSPVPAFKVGERTNDPLQMYLADIYTVTGSLAGLPGISVPCGKIGGELPVGMQIFGPAFGEAKVLQLAHAFEAAGGAAV